MVKRRWAVLRAAVSALLLGWLFSRLDIGTVVDVARGVSPWRMAAALALAFSVMLLFAWRWHVLLRAVEVRLPFRTVCALTYVGHFFTQLLPTSIGGEAVKLYYATGLTGRRVEVLLSLVIDRTIGFVALLAVPWPALLAQGFEGRLARTAGTVYLTALVSTVGGIVVLVGLGRWPWLTRALARWPRIGRVRLGLTAYSRARLAVVAAFAAAVCSHVLNAGIYWVVAGALGDGFRFGDYLALVPLVFLPALLPISVGGLGVREMTFVYLFEELGMARQAALSVAILVLAVNVGLGAIGAATYVGTRRSLNRGAAPESTR